MWCLEGDQNSNWDFVLTWSWLPYSSQVKRASASNQCLKWRIAQRFIPMASTCASTSPAAPWDTSSPTGWKTRGLWTHSCSAISTGWKIEKQCVVVADILIGHCSKKCKSWHYGWLSSIQASQYKHEGEMVSHNTRTLKPQMLNGTQPFFVFTPVVFKVCSLIQVYS